MKKFIVMLAAAAFIVGCDTYVETPPAPPAKTEVAPPKADVPPAPAVLLDVKGMIGVDKPYLSKKTVRGVLGDEQPWAISSGAGTLYADGHLKLDVKGLVFTDKAQPKKIRGINDEKYFRAVVSCLLPVESPARKAKILKVKTVNTYVAGKFAATKTGDSIIDGTAKLPKTCDSPAVFVMSGSEPKWFAVSDNVKK